MKTRTNKETTKKNKTSKTAGDKKVVRDMTSRKDPKGGTWPPY